MCSMNDVGSQGIQPLRSGRRLSSGAVLGSWIPCLNTARTIQHAGACHLITAEACMEECDIAAWVQRAPDAAQRELRQAVHTVLVAIGRSSDLQPHMIMKGGILLAIRYESSRYTRDIDFSTAQRFADFIRRHFVRSLKADSQWRSRSSTTAWIAACNLTPRDPKRRSPKFQPSQ